MPKCEEEKASKVLVKTVSKEGWSASVGKRRNARVSKRQVVIMCSFMQ